MGQINVAKSGGQAVCRDIISANEESETHIIQELRNLEMRRLELLDKMDSLAKSA